MRLLLLIGIVGVVVALYGADRLVKARARARRRRVMSVRLEAATTRAGRQHDQHQAAEQASQALTSFMPAIQRPPSDLPGVPGHGPARPRTARDRADQHDAARPDHEVRHDHDSGHAPRRAPRSGEYEARPADRAAHGEAGSRPHPQRDGRPAAPLR